jgi:CRISPR-associated protein Csd1
MILQSLVDYYELLAKNDKISKPGYCMAKVSYALNLSKDGEFIGVIPLKIPAERGKKTVELPQSMEVPEQYKKSSGVRSNFLCENSAYMLGMDKSSDNETKRAKECFDAFCELHKDVLSNARCEESNAILQFLESWQPEKGTDHPSLKVYLDDILASSNLVFIIEGKTYAHECPAIKKAWDNYIQQNPNSIEMQCLVTGQISPIARLHHSIKGIKGAQSSGASLVSFNAEAYESYGHDKQQGLNAPVSEYAAFAYTTALNYLLTDTAHKTVFGDTTVVYWAESTKPIYQDIFAYCLDPEQIESDTTDDRKTSNLIGSIFQKLVEGSPVSDVSGELDADTRFYILGLAPNAARLSVRFFMRNTFGAFVEKLMEHYRNMEIQKAPNDREFVPLWKLMQETVSLKSTDKASSPLLSGAVLRAILTGSQYPAALYNSIMIRIRAEHEVTRGKAAAIKAYLMKQQNNSVYKEVLTVSLNEQSENRAYVLGRLFSVLEKAQLDATPGIKATIKDRYFTSACATPASVFPVLLRLSNHHISKSDYGYISDIRLRDLMDKLNVDSKPFPAHLSLDEQGLFILGYYHQQKANYTKINKEEK